MAKSRASAVSINWVDTVAPPFRAALAGLKPGAAADSLSRPFVDTMLERKDRLKINAAICGLGSATRAAAEEPTNRVRLAKQGRADSPDPRPEVYVIK